MRERHNTKSRTDHTPARSVKIQTPPPTPLVALCKQVWQLGDVARYAPSFIESKRLGDSGIVRIRVAVDMGKSLSVGIADLKTTGNPLDSPG